jgi:hypothetical protein
MNRVGKAISVQSYYRPIGYRVVDVPSSPECRYMKVVSLSVQSTGCLYPPGNIPGTHFC